MNAPLKEVDMLAWGMGLFIGNLMMCVSDFEMEPPTHKNFVEQNECIRTNSRLKLDSCIHTYHFILLTL